MLVLSRFAGEKIIIGGGITIMIVEVRGDKVRVGIDAPRTTSIDREEVFAAKQKEEEDKSLS